MSFPEFFAQVPRITVRDPLAGVLGSSSDGLIEYGYADAVRLTGHSCPTVAGAYLLTLRALRRLFPEGPAERGGVRVRCRDGNSAGVTGVIANVISLLTGAAGAGGFQGLGGRFARRNLLEFDAPIAALVRFERVDNGAAVDVDYHPERVPAAPALRELLPQVIAGVADGATQREFQALWQERVRRILVEHADDECLVTVTAVSPGGRG